MTARAAALDPTTELMRVRAELTGARRVIAAQRKQLAAGPNPEALLLLTNALSDVDGVARVLEDAAPSYSITLHVAADDIRTALGLLDADGGERGGAS